MEFHSKDYINNIKINTVVTSVVTMATPWCDGGGGREGFHVLFKGGGTRTTRDGRCGLLLRWLGGRGLWVLRWLGRLPFIRTQVS